VLVSLAPVVRFGAPNVGRPTACQGAVAAYPRFAPVFHDPRDWPLFAGPRGGRIRTQQEQTDETNTLRLRSLHLRVRR